MNQRKVTTKSGTTKARKGYGKLVPIDEANISGTAWAVWAALATFAKWETDHGQPIQSLSGSCIPTMETLAKRAHLDRRTVFRALKELEEAGYVRRQERRNTPRREGSKGKQRSNGYDLYPLGNAPRTVTENAPMSPEQIAKAAGEFAKQLQAEAQTVKL